MFVEIRAARHSLPLRYFRRRAARPAGALPPPRPPRDGWSPPLPLLPGFCHRKTDRQNRRLGCSSGADPDTYMTDIATQNFLEIILDIHSYWPMLGSNMDDFSRQRSRKNRDNPSLAGLKQNIEYSSHISSPSEYHWISGPFCCHPS